MFLRHYLKNLLMTIFFDLHQPVLCLWPFIKNILKPGNFWKFLKKTVPSVFQASLEEFVDDNYFWFTPTSFVFCDHSFLHSKIWKFLEFSKKNGAECFSGITWRICWWQLFLIYTNQFCVCDHFIAFNDLEKTGNFWKFLKKKRCRVFSGITKRICLMTNYFWFTPTSFVFVTIFLHFWLHQPVLCLWNFWKFLKKTVPSVFQASLEEFVDDNYFWFTPTNFVFVTIHFCILKPRNFWKFLKKTVASVF